MALVDAADVESLLGRELTEAETSRFPGLLTQAKALIEGYTRRTFTDPYPDVVKVVAAQIIANVLAAPKESAMVESSQVSAGPFSVNHRYSADSTSGSAWLTVQLKTMLSGFRSSMVSVPLQSERTL